MSGFELFLYLVGIFIAFAAGFASGVLFVAKFSRPNF